MKIDEVVVGAFYSSTSWRGWDTAKLEALEVGVPYRAYFGAKAQRGVRLKVIQVWGKGEVGQELVEPARNLTPWGDQAVQRRVARYEEEADASRRVNALWERTGLPVRPFAGRPDVVSLPLSDLETIALGLDRRIEFAISDGERDYRLAVAHRVDQAGEHYVELAGLGCSLEGEMPGEYYPRPTLDAELGEGRN
jgi:hypothetical protein